LKKGIRGFTCKKKKQADFGILVQKEEVSVELEMENVKYIYGISLTGNGEVSQEWGATFGHPQVRNERGKQEV